LCTHCLPTNSKVLYTHTIARVLCTSILYTVGYPRGITPWRITVSYLDAHPNVNPTCRPRIVQLLSAHWL